MQEPNEIKQRLRQDMLHKRRCLPAPLVAAQSETIAAFFYAWQRYQAAETVMLYLAMRDEPQADAMITHALSRGKRVCVPLLGAAYGQMEAVAINGLSNLLTGKLGLRVPDPAQAKVVNPGEIDLVVVPGVVFDEHGHRIGMGAGYYDRFLPRAEKAVRLGLAWAFQVVEDVPQDKYDVAMDYLLTEGGFNPCLGGKQ